MARKRRRKAKSKKKFTALKALGEKDIVVGVALLVLGGVLATAPKINSIMNMRNIIMRS